MWWVLLDRPCFIHDQRGAINGRPSHSGCRRCSSPYSTKRGVRRWRNSTASIDWGLFPFRSSTSRCSRFMSMIFVVSSRQRSLSRCIMFTSASALRLLDTKAAQIAATTTTEPINKRRENMASPEDWLKRKVSEIQQRYATEATAASTTDTIQITHTFPDNCIHRGEELTGHERESLGLSHQKTWFPCNHPDKPLGKAHVCPCMGCGNSAKCSGYTMSSRTSTTDLHMSANGIGDAVCGLYAACGLADTGVNVTFHTKHPGWFVNVRHPNLTIKVHSSAGLDISTEYNAQLKASTDGSCESRVHWYCRNISRSLGIAKFEPSRPRYVANYEPVLSPSYILLSPFSLYKSREWPEHKWTELARELATIGKSIIAIGRRDDRDRLQRVFGRTPITWRWGQNEHWVSSAVAHADWVIGNDSGIVHVAGLHGTKAVAIMTHINADFVFGKIAPTIVGVTADREQWPCLGCAWRGDKGFKNHCNSSCQALQSIDVSKVRISLL